MAVDGRETIKCMKVGLDFTSVMHDQPTKVVIGYLF